MAELPIFVATMTGTAQLAAQEVADALNANGTPARIVLMDNLGADAIDGHDVFLVVSSTYGHGDIPDNGQAFYLALKTQSPDLKGKRYAVFALGDRSFDDTYCAAGEAFDEVFADCGAERIAPVERHDACSGTLPEDAAKEWALKLPLNQEVA